MTIRLLVAHGPYPVSAIVTLDAATEAGLIAAKQASANLTGGVPYVAPVGQAQVKPVEAFFDPVTGGIGKTHGSDLLPEPTARLRAAARGVCVAKMPADIVLMGDSTGDETTEWPFLMMQALSKSLAQRHAVAYRTWSDARQQYSDTTYITEGPKGRQYIAAGASATSHRIEVSCSPVTGDLTAVLECDLNGGGPNAQFAACAAYGGAGARGWRFELKPDNTLFFEHSSDGTVQINRSSSAAIPSQVLNGGRVFIRVKLDVDNGDGGNTCSFEYSYDKTQWTSIGVANVKSGTTSIFATTAPLQFIGRGGGSISNLGKNFGFYGLEVFASLDNTSLRASVDCGSVPPRTTMTSIAYRDDVGNLGTIYFQGSEIFGSPRLCLLNASVGGQVIAYAIDAGNSNARFGKLAAGQCNAVMISYSHNEGADVTYRADYKALCDLVIARNPDAAIIGVLQNQRTGDAFSHEHLIRLQQIAAFCASSGYDTLDMYGAVDADTLKVDGIHPDPARDAEVPIAARAHLLWQVAAGCWSVPS